MKLLAWNGQKYGEGSYKEVDLDGNWTWWYANGQINEEDIHQNGEFVKGTNYSDYNNGQIEEKVSYKDGK